MTIAERLVSTKGARVLIVERRNHIGGNAHDHYDDAGVLIHRYGPHYFRTNAPRIRAYLSKFTDWTPVDYTIKSFTRDRYWNFPVNLNTFEQLIGRPATSGEFVDWLEQNKVSIENPRNSEEIILSQVGHELYELFFKGYTLKQWKRHPRDLDASVCGRIPIRTNRDDRYLKEEFQALPSAGYHRIFERMAQAMGENVKILLNTDYREVLPHVQFDHMVYTGPIDAYFDFAHGKLPYRSLRFEFESFEGKDLADRESVSGKPGFWQPAMQVNYPDESVPWTRIVEIKHATGQQCLPTTIVREFPEDFGAGKEPYYPVPNAESAAVYKKYKEMADALPNVSFIGRLATYRYYNMDQVVGMALAEADKLQSREI